MLSKPWHPGGPHTLSRHSHLAAGQVEVLDSARRESVQHRADTPVERAAGVGRRHRLSEEAAAVVGPRSGQRLLLDSRMATETPHQEGALTLGIDRSQLACCESSGLRREVRPEGAEILQKAMSSLFSRVAPWPGARETNSSGFANMASRCPPAQGIFSLLHC